jgi:hypothetical protein
MKGINNSHDVAMYFHSAFRNVGLFGSFSLAGLGAAKALNYNSDLEGFLMVFSICLMVISFLVNVFLLLRLKNMSVKFDEISMWIIISGLTLLLQVAFLVYAFYLGTLKIFDDFVK